MDCELCPTVLPWGMTDAQAIREHERHKKEER